MDYEALVLEGVNAVRQLEGAQWKLGDLALSVETAYGEHTLERYAEAIGVDFGMLQNYRRVAKAYEKSVRTSISWSHHERVAARPDRLEWLKQAAENGWSVRQMQEAIKEADLRPLPENIVEQVQEAMAAADNPIEAAKEVLEQYDPPTPSQAASLAVATGLAVEDSEGWMHDNRTKEQVEREADEITERQLFIQSLARMPRLGSPREVAYRFPVYLREDIDVCIERAQVWLQEFLKAWRERWSIP